MEKILEDLSGQRFGRLKVIEYAYSKNKIRIWKCLCDCGNIVFVGTHTLKCGHTKSCGCFQKEKVMERSLKHGLAHKLPLYYVWKTMRERCFNSNNKYYKDYGGRGIKVCEDWNDYQNFHDWAFANGYKQEKLPNGKNKWTLDRIDVNGNYEPNNCRWVTISIQATNKRNNLFVKVDNTKRLLIDLCREKNMPFELVYERVHCYKWDVERALNTKKRKLENGKKCE